MTVNSSDSNYITQAIELALANSQDGQNGPFGALVVRDRVILGKAGNSVIATCDPTAHAEIVAIREACRSIGSHDLSGCTIYCSCEPCPMCLGAILWARINRVVYACSRTDAAGAGFDDESFYREMGMDWSKRSISAVQLSREAGLKAFAAWKAHKSSKMY